MIISYNYQTKVIVYFEEEKMLKIKYSKTWSLISKLLIRKTYNIL
jgi:hypothetical protein